MNLSFDPWLTSASSTKYPWSHTQQYVLVSLLPPTAVCGQHLAIACTASLGSIEVRIFAICVKYREHYLTSQCSRMLDGLHSVLSCMLDCSGQLEIQVPMKMRKLSVVPLPHLVVEGEAGITPPGKFCWSWAVPCGGSFLWRIHHGDSWFCLGLYHHC